MDISKSLRIFTAAKINLYLEVGAKNLNGYHSLKTIFQSIDLFDQLEISLDLNTQDKNININIENLIYKDALPQNIKENLIYKASKAFFKKAKISNYNLNINLFKNIAVAAGLGGGSADSAGIIFALNYICGEILNQEELLEITKEIGSDVPFCLLGGRMIGTGRGDQLIRLPLRNNLIILLISPPIELETKTKDIYEAYDQFENKIFKPKISFESFVSLLNNAGPEEIRNNLYNSLEEVVINNCFWVEELKSFLESKNINAIISGSGASVFSVFGDVNHAQIIAEELRLKGYKVGIHNCIENPFEIEINS